MSGLSEGEIRQLVEALTSAIESDPLKLAIVGISGVGKSSTINALFDTDLKISHTVACTKEFTSVPVSVDLRQGTSTSRAALHVIDAPGLGESIDADPHYLARYQEELPSCDVVLWVIGARNRGLVLDQRYLSQLCKFSPNIVFAVNQVDLVEPMDWTAANIPSQRQREHIAAIQMDRSEKLGSVLGEPPAIVPYSAAKKFNLSILFGAMIDALAEERRALYDLIRTFRFEDQFSGRVPNVGENSEFKRAPAKRGPRERARNYVKRILQLDFSSCFRRGK